MSFTGEWEVRQPARRRPAPCSSPRRRGPRRAHRQQRARQGAAVAPLVRRRRDLRQRAAEAYGLQLLPGGRAPAARRDLRQRRAAPRRSPRSTVPTLVIHGRDDTLIPPAGGQRTAELIPSASLLLLADMGHDLPGAAGADDPRCSDQPRSARRRSVSATLAASTSSDLEELHMPGPLAGTRIIELAGIGPGPFAAMLLVRHGRGGDPRRAGRARAAARPGPATTRCATGAASPSTSSTPTASRPCCDMVEQSDALIEGFRPGVTERLGSGPTTASARNPKLVYGRMTGWGQDGSVRAVRRPRHQLHLAGGRSPHIGRADQPPDPAAQPRRRLRRRGDVPRLRRGLRAARGRPERPGARSSTRRWSTARRR